MIATKPADIRSRQKEYFEEAYNGETIVVSRPQNHNVVIISEESYNKLLQAARMQEYVNRLYGGRTDERGKERDPWDTFFEGIDMFTDDFMVEGRGMPAYEVRESL